MQKQYNLQNKEYYIVYIEDNPCDVILLKEANENHGFPISLRHILDGDIAIDLILKNNLNQYYLVIIDINFPKVVGITILDFLKQSQRYKKTSIIILLSSNNESGINICHRLVLGSRLTKSFDCVQYETIAKSISDMYLPLSRNDY